MGNLIVYQEYKSAPVKIKITKAQVQALITFMQVVETGNMPRLELDALREILRKFYLKVQRKVLLMTKPCFITISDTELWALFFIFAYLPTEGYDYEKACLYQLQDAIRRRCV